MGRGPRPAPESDAVIPIDFRSEAAAEIEDAARWYGWQGPALRDQLLMAVADTVKLIARNPMQFRVLHRGTRRALLRRFPFGLYYRVTDERVLIVAFLHVRRDPRTWQVRDPASVYVALSYVA